MSDTLSPTVRDCIDAVSATFDGLFATIEGWRQAVESLAGPVGSARIDELVERLVLPSLSADDALTIGAGFVATPGFLADVEWHLAWWLGHANTFGVGSADPAVRRLEAEEDPASENFRDYTTLEWWRVPAATGARHITGPYVDYLCTDDYTLTLTMPAFVDGRMIGLVGADLYVNDIERRLLPRVRAVGGPATIINASGRVVVSTDPHRATGTILRSDAPAISCGDSSLRLVLG